MEEKIKKNEKTVEQIIDDMNLFDDDLSYLKNCSYRKEASAVGVAKQFFWKVMEII